MESLSFLSFKAQPASILLIPAVNERARLQLTAHDRAAVTTHGCVPHHPLRFRVTVQTWD